MKFEEVLSALREGRKIRCKRWGYDVSLYLEGSKLKYSNDLYDYEYPIDIHDVISVDWEIVPIKVKYYPCLTHYDNIFMLSTRKFPNINEAQQDVFGFVRLITEIPELIEEREE